MISFDKSNISTLYFEKIHAISKKGLKWTNDIWEKMPIFAPEIKKSAQNDTTFKRPIFAPEIKKSAQNETTFKINSYLCNIVHYWTTT